MNITIVCQLPLSTSFLLIFGLLIRYTICERKSLIMKAQGCY
jgi:hypothetical protein